MQSNKKIYASIKIKRISVVIKNDNIMFVRRRNKSDKRVKGFKNRDTVNRSKFPVQMFSNPFCQMCN